VFVFTVKLFFFNLLRFSSVLTIFEKGGSTSVRDHSGCAITWKRPS